MGRSTLIGSVCGKIWGNTKCLFCDSISEVHYLEIVKGGYCSKHSHKNKWNRFVVLSGILEVIIYKENNEDITTLTKAMITDVQPGIYHRFQALDEATVLEIYWTDNLDPMDIDRIEDQGGGVDKKQENKVSEQIKAAPISFPTDDFPPSRILDEDVHDKLI